MTLEHTIQCFACLDCPWAWVTWEALMQKKQQALDEKNQSPNNILLNTDIEWNPFILDSHIPFNGEPFTVSAKKMGYDWTDQQVDDYVNSPTMQSYAKEVGLNWVKRNTRFNVVRASIFAMYAKELGSLNAFVTAAYRQYFCSSVEEDKNLYDPRVLKIVVQKIGINNVDPLSIVENPKYIQQFKATMEQVNQLGIHATPALYNPKNSRTHIAAIQINNIIPVIQSLI